MLIRFSQRIKHFVLTNRLLACATIASGSLTILANRSGVGWSWDSSDYVAVGKNFASGAGLLDATGLPMTVRPPGLSVLISAGDLVGLGVNLTVQILNAVCAMVLVVGVYHLLQIANTKKSVALLASTFVASSPALLWQYSMIWSEPPFIALSIIAMIISLQPMNRVKFFSLAFLFTTLFFIRYVGPVFSVTIAFTSILLDRRQLGLIKSALANLLALAVSLVPVWFWLQRNEDIDGTLTGARAPGGGSLIDPLKTFSATVGSWLSASPIEGGIYLSSVDYPSTAKVLGVLFWVALTLLIFGYLFLQSRDGRLLELPKVFLLSASVAVTYIAFSAYRFVHWELGPLDNRMMIPVFVPLVLVVAIAIDRIKLGSKLLRQIIASLFALFVAYQAVSSATDAYAFGRDGRHWAAATVKTLPIHQFVVSLPSDSLLMSNQPQQLYSIWQKSSVYNQYQLDLAQSAACDRRYFVWYNSTYDDGTPNDEGKPKNAKTIYVDRSGMIFDLGDCASEINFYWP